MSRSELLLLGLRLARESPLFSSLEEALGFLRERIAVEKVRMLVKETAKRSGADLSSLIKEGEKRGKLSSEPRLMTLRREPSSEDETRAEDERE